MTGPEHENGLSATAFIASVRLFDNQACTDNHPLARVRYGRRDAFTGWRHIRHDDLEAATGHSQSFRQSVDDHAQFIVSRIRQMVAGGLPAITDFGELHDHFDANVGWSEQIDELDPFTWAWITWRVTDILRVD